MSSSPTSGSRRALPSNDRRIRSPFTLVFTLPPLARVGILEREATEMGLKFRTEFGETSKWYSSRRIGEEWSGYEVLIEEETDRILGAHLLAPTRRR